MQFITAVVYQGEVLALDEENRVWKLTRTLGGVPVMIQELGVDRQCREWIEAVRQTAVARDVARK